jgi:hypothetical protein
LRSRAAVYAAALARKGFEGLAARTIACAAACPLLVSIVVINYQIVIVRWSNTISNVVGPILYVV